MVGSFISKFTCVVSDIYFLLFKHWLRSYWKITCSTKCVIFLIARVVFPLNVLDATSRTCSDAIRRIQSRWIAVQPIGKQSVGLIEIEQMFHHVEIIEIEQMLGWSICFRLYFQLGKATYSVLTNSYSQWNFQIPFVSE